MNYWNWLNVYLFLTSISLGLHFIGVRPVFEIILAVVALAYLVAFTFWPYLVDDEHKKSMELQAKANAEYEIKRSEDYYKSLEEWLVVKSYVDASQVYEMHEDKAKLDGQSIKSYVKSAGITTLSVHKNDFEKACEILGILPISDADV